MCGITGIISTGTIDRIALNSMMMALGHRGPDAHGVWLDSSECLGLGHTRLSIIDLSEEANQPFHSGNGRYVIAFNGEIYNFQEIRRELSQKGIPFRTHSDTEVIVEAFAAWGAAMVNRLDGMFAIAIVDQHEKRLHLFRDRIGKKPLYYYQSGGVFAFASELKSLMTDPAIRNDRKINRQAMANFFHLGYIPEPDSIYEHIHKFPAGHTGEINRGLDLILRPYWRIDDKLDLPRIENVAEGKERFNQILEDAVQKRLISDVPLGAFLSGGTDSSLVSAVACKYVAKPLKTFSIGFKESKFDESRYAKAVAAHLKTDHSGYILAEKEAVGCVEKYLCHFDEPFADTSAIPTLLVSQLARQEVKAVLTGDGGDELFQGYGAYQWADRLDRNSWKLLKGPLRTLLRASGQSRLERVAHLLDPARPGGLRSHIFSQEQYYFSQREVFEDLLKNPVGVEAFEYNDSFLAAGRQAGERQALFDLRYYLKDDLLVKVDRASMAYALECRCPLLDHRLVEFALALDPMLKNKERKGKWIEKELLRQYLPDALVDRPKWGFSVPLAAWMKGDLHYLMDNYLDENLMMEAGLCHAGYVLKLKKEFMSGKDYLYNRLWTVIVMHKWWKENQ